MPARLAPVLVSLAALLVPAFAAAAEDAEPAGAAAYRRCLEMARAELARRPGDPHLARVLARVHFQQGRFRDAAEAFEAGLEKSPGNPELLLGLAASRDRLGERDAAALALDRAIRSGRRDVRIRARLALADLRGREGRWEDAVRVLEKVQADGAVSPATRYELGRALEARALELRVAGKSEDAAELERRAQATFEAVLALDSKHAASHYALGRLLVRQGEREAGRRHLDAFRRCRRAVSGVDARALARSPAEFECDITLELARAWLELGRAERALEFVDRALDMQPDSIDARALRGWIYLRSGREADAERAYRALLAVRPDHAEALWNLGSIRLRSGDAQEAGDLILRAAQARGRFPEAWELLFRLAAEGRVHSGRAEEFARRALRERPSEENHLRFATWLFEQGNPEGAREVLGRARARFPRSESVAAALRAIAGTEGGER